MWGLEKDGIVEPVSIAFITSFWYTSSWYTLWLVNCDSILQHLCQTFDFTCTESNEPVHLYSMTVKPSYTAPFDLWHLTYHWHRKCFFRNWMGSAWIEVHVHVFEKMFTGSILLSSCSFSLIHYFTAHLLFHSSALTKSLAQATQYCTV